MSDPADRKAFVDDASVVLPPPVEGDGDVWLGVIDDMRKRREFGIKKYGLPLQRGNGRISLLDAYQEALDLAVYLRMRLEEDGTLKPAVVDGEQ